jgi:hypothetical protein
VGRYSRSKQKTTASKLLAASDVTTLSSLIIGTREVKFMADNRKIGPVVGVKKKKKIGKAEMDKKIEGRSKTSLRNVLTGNT